MKSASSKTNTNSNKSKKNAKDREKRKSVVVPEKEVQNNNDKGSPNKDGGIRKYAGIGPDSVIMYAEQSTFEQLSEEVSAGLAEDLSYKLRYIIHDALIKARLSGRNHILSSDIDVAFNALNIEKVYGATSMPNWVSLGDQNCYYLDDPIVNLLEVAEQESVFIQPGDVLCLKQWLPDTRDLKALKCYFEAMCVAVVANDVAARNFALNDIKTNNFIGPIVNWFYHFAYFLLSKDVTYDDSLTLSALSLINALENNPVATLSVGEKELELLVRLILQRLLRSKTTIDVLKPMSLILAILSRRLPVRELVLIKLKKKIPEVKENCTHPILYIINAIGFDAIKEIFIPYMEFFLLRAEHNLNPDFVSSILQTYSIVCRNYKHASLVDEAFYNFFGDSLCVYWNYTNQKPPDELDINWLIVKMKLMRSRRKIAYSNKATRKFNIREVFPDYNEAMVQEYMEIDDGLGDRNSGVHFKISRLNRSKTFSTDFIDSLMRVESYSPEGCTPEISLLSRFMNSRQKYITIGKRALLISRFKNFKHKYSEIDKCCDHSMKYYNL